VAASLTKGMGASMEGTCAGLRVLDLTQGMAGPLATMVLADFGADVVRVEPPEGDPLWSDPSYLLVQRGKQSVTLDSRTGSGRQELGNLARGMDVIVESIGSEAARRAGVGYDELSAADPGLVYCSISGFGSSGPFAQVKADDGLVMAKAGIFRDQPGWFGDGRRPVYRAPRDGSYFAAMLAVQGILAALVARDRTGRGQLVETNLLQALSCRQNPKVRWLLREGESLPIETSSHAVAIEDEHSLAHHRDPREINLIGMRVQCKDGRWMVHSHTEPHFFPAWISVLGFEWIWEDERFKGAPHQFPDDAAKVELVELIADRMKEKTSAEWMEAYLENGNVCGDVIQSTQEALRHRQIVETDNVHHADDPRVGSLLQIGPLAKIPGAPASIRSAAPAAGHDQAAAVLGRAEKLSAPAPDRARVLRGPLDGVTIVECAYYYATPFATALLADLGARVIKIERLQGDPYRLLGGDPYGMSDGASDPVLNLGHNNMVRAMQGKESIALNLKDERGREILHRLVAQADVFVHSFRPGVPESLGIDYETLRRVNPDLVYQYGASYGSTGPYCRQPAIDPIIAAFAGTTVYQAGEGNLPLTETGADPVAAAGHATAMVLGLFARHRTGKGQYVESSMIVSNIYLNCDDALSYEGKPARRAVDHMQLGTGPTRRLYETAAPPEGSVRESYQNPDSCWVFLSAEGDDEFRTFCDVAGRTDVADEERFATTAARDANAGALSEILGDVFRTRPAEDWETSLLAAGVGCVTADAMSNFAFLFRDPQALANGIMVETEHPSFGGRYWRHAPMLRFSDTPGEARPHCELGEHTRAILQELGYDQSAMTDLREADVVGWPTAHTDTVSVGS
jgi:crotonobetainyl-CoA:carnitine CoA-transferase CaiB-like acyl-CoA transferase